MTVDLDACLREVTSRLLSLARYRASGPITGNDIRRLRTVPVPVQRKAVDAGYSFVTTSRADNLAVWNYIWTSSAYLEVMSQAVYFYQQSRRRPLERYELTTILSWALRCTCWEHSDDLSKVYAHAVEQRPEWILPTLRRWNSSENSWLRRMSMTSLIEYATKRTCFLPYNELMSFVEPLIGDREYYVQKGLGWTVREIGNAYPEQVQVFMEQHAARLSPQAWTGATKNMDKTARARLLAIRKAP